MRPWVFRLRVARPLPLAPVCRGRISTPAFFQTYPLSPANADLHNTQTIHGPNTAHTAPLIESFLPAAAFTPIAIRKSDHSQIRSNDEATDSTNLLLVTGSMKAPALNTSGLSSRKSSGFFKN